MAAAEIRDQTLSQLRATRTAMLSARWTLTLEGKDTATKEQAAKELLRVHHAIQKLENEQLANIRDKLLENEADLAKGREKLAKALENLNRTAAVLTAVGQLLEVVGKVAPLIL